MADEKRIKIKAILKKYRNADIDEVFRTYDNTDTKRMALSLMRGLLSHLGLPDDKIPYDVLNYRYKEVIEYIKDKYPTMPKLRQMLLTICGTLTRTGFTENNKLRTAVDEQFPFVMQCSRKEMPPDWNKVCEVLARVSEDRMMSNAVRIISYFYLYGYTFRTGQIYDIAVAEGDGSINHLDFDSGQLYICKQKNGKKRSVRLPKELLDKIRPLSGSKFLIQAPRGAAFGRKYRTFTAQGWQSPWTVAEYRASREMYINNESGYDEATVKEWDYILGHNPQTVQNYLYRDDCSDE